MRKQRISDRRTTPFIKQAVPHRVVDQFPSVGQIHFLQNAGLVGTDGLHAKAQMKRDV